MQDFGRGFARTCETLGEDLQGFVRHLGDDLTRICEIFGRRILEGLCKTLGRGFARICETLEEDLQGFTRLCEMICETLGEDSQVFARL